MHYYNYYNYIGDSSESESSTDSSTDILSSSVESGHDHDDYSASAECGSNHYSDDHNLDAAYPTSSYDNYRDVPDYDYCPASALLSESQTDHNEELFDTCDTDSPDTCDTDSPAGDSDSSESEEDCNGLSDDYAFMTESFYEGSNVTAGKAVLSVMEFCINDHLTYKATDELLKLLQVLCVTPNKLPNSVYLLKKHFRDFKRSEYSFKRSEYSHNKACSKCRKDSSNCSCDDPSHGDLITIPIEKPLEAIVSSKYPHTAINDLKPSW